MKSHLYHLQINIDFANRSFYKDLLSILGWSLIFEMEGVIGYKSHTTGDLWFVDSLKKVKSDYDQLGVNHIGIRVENEEAVDSVVEFLNGKKVKSLFDTPRHRPEFAESEKHTYYQVMFESPDKILFEVVYVGSKR